MKYLLLILFGILSLSIGCKNPASSDKQDNENLFEADRPININGAVTHRDSVYILDNCFYSENNNLKPPCSVSPDFKGCIISRAKQLNISEFKP